MTARIALALSLLCFTACSPHQDGTTGPGGGSGGSHDLGTGTGGNAGGGGGGSGGGGGGGNGGGGPMACAVTCQQLGATCGTQTDGCGGTQDCGACTAPDSCGGGGMANQCGATTGGGACVKHTCKDLNANCGMQGDGCGGLIDCGSCTAPAICGGGNTPSQCGNSSTPPCTGLCLQQQTCPNGTTTTISGTVHAPTTTAYGTADPIYGALVYVPNGTVSGFGDKVTCGTCTNEVTGNPLISVTTGIDGKFTLTNAPVGSNIPVVIQLGRWRRQIKVNVTACVNNAVPDDTARLPRNHNEGDIPKIAVVTGNADAIECVLPKIGIDSSEFTVPPTKAGDPDGRVHLYRNNGAYITSKTVTPIETDLTTDVNTLEKYDMVILDCIGTEIAESSVYQQNMVDYAQAGGRVFASHYSYVWLDNIAPFSGAAQWDVDTNSVDKLASQTATIDQNTQLGKDFASWLQLINASPIKGQIEVDQTRRDVDAVKSSSVEWMTGTQPGNSSYPLEFTYDTGVTGGPTCGRVLFSDFHVNTGGAASGLFPDECGTKPAAMTPQEHVLEFMLFNLTSCITPVTPPPPTCTKTSCMAQMVSCGQIGDGCGGLIDCGACMLPDTCGGGGTPGQCGHVNQCMPLTCAQQNLNCGQAGDGCGNVIDCGTCTPPLTCGGGGTPGQCGGIS